MGWLHSSLQRTAGDAPGYVRLYELHVSPEFREVAATVVAAVLPTARGTLDGADPDARAAGIGGIQSLPQRSARVW